MPDLRINFFGGSGAGASTLGRACAEHFDISYFDSDDFYHVPTDPPFQRQYTPEERAARMAIDLRNDTSWVLGGGIVGWDPLPELQFTHVVLVYLPTADRMKRLLDREQRRFGDRIAAGGDLCETHREFVEWAARYDVGDRPGKSLAIHERFLQKAQCAKLKLVTNRPVDELLAEVIAFIKSS
ncbi:MAG: hypothetical protein R3C03_10580 [Pirellulaceae bacterium]